jgi:hypothetical protein
MLRMVRRISTTLAVLAIALAVYAVFTGVIFQRITTRFIGTGCLHDRRTCPTCRGTPAPDRHHPIIAATAAVMIGILPFITELTTRLRRRRRFLNDECIECGRPITSWRGRCPGCGVRVGPG